MANLDGHLLAAEEVDPAALVILQAVPRPFDLDHPIARLAICCFRHQLNEVRQACAIVLEIPQQAGKTAAQVRGGQAVKRHGDQRFAQHSPMHEGGSKPLLVLPGSQNRRAVAAILQLRQAGVDLCLALAHEVFAIEVRRPAVE